MDIVQVLARALLGISPAVAAAEPPLATDLAPPVRIEAAGKPIDVKIGHAAPCVGDFDGNGTPDLLVGQFGDGALRIHLNSGSAREWKLAEHTLLEAGGEQGKVPSG